MTMKRAGDDTNVAEKTLTSSGVVAASAPRLSSATAVVVAEARPRYPLMLAPSTLYGGSCVAPTAACSTTADEPTRLKARFPSARTSGVLASDAG